MSPKSILVHVRTLLGSIPTTALRDRPKFRHFASKSFVLA